jgi:hypothetical protein
LKKSKEEKGDYGAIPVKYVKKDGLLLGPTESRREIASMMNDKFNKHNPQM